MPARYLIRLDDACPTMRLEMWDRLEQAMDSLGIRPIVGVIPENRDESMLCSPPDPAFWEKVRRWQGKGWSIALHGLHHVYHRIPEGKQALLPIHTQSEFAGLPLDAQRAMLRKACARFKEEGVQPGMFMAPSHTFDAATIEALRLETGIRVITDGYALQPFRQDGFTWIPQQLWRLRPLPFGVWTVALHPNTMSHRELERVVADMRRYASKMAHPKSVLTHPAKEHGFGDGLFSAAYLAALNLKRWVRR